MLFKKDNKGYRPLEGRIEQVFENDGCRLLYYMSHGHVDKTEFVSEICLYFGVTFQVSDVKYSYFRNIPNSNKQKGSMMTVSITNPGYGAYPVTYVDDKDGEVLRWEKFVELSKRTMPKYTNKNIALAVFGLGLTGEAGELTSTNWDNLYSVIEELGDLLWYVALGSCICNVTVVRDSYLPVVYNECEEIVWEMYKTLSVIADHIKKVIAQGHHLDKDTIKSNLDYIVSLAQLICRMFEIDLGVVLEYNVEKLKTRYPNGFEAKCSIE